MLTLERGRERRERNKKGSGGDEGGIKGLSYFLLIRLSVDAALIPDGSTKVEPSSSLFLCPPSVFDKLAYLRSLASALETINVKSNLTLSGHLLHAESCLLALKDYVPRLL